MTSSDSAEEMMSVSQRDDGEMDEDLSPFEEPEIVSTTEHKWECEHCTYVNKAGTRVCAVCCRTTSKNPPRTINERRNSRGRVDEVVAVRTNMTENNKHVSNKRQQNKVELDPVEEIAAAVNKQLRVTQNEQQQVTTKKGRLRRISFWPGTKFYS